MVAVFALRILSSLLYGVSAADPLTLGGVWAVLMLMCILAGYIPARRATRLDPRSALRHE